MTKIRTTTARVRPGIYARGADTVDAILKAAKHVLVEEGASAFTLQRIATQCGLKVGHVNHHFPRKEMIVQVLVEEILTTGEDQIDGVMRKPGILPEVVLAELIVFMLNYIRTKNATRLYTELWAMANNNEFVAGRVEALDRYVQTLITEFVMKTNPRLGPEDAGIVALYIYGSTKGMIAFAGYEKPWASQMPQITNIAVANLIHLVKTITPEVISALSPFDSLGVTDRAMPLVPQNI